VGKGCCIFVEFGGALLLWILDLEFGGSREVGGSLAPKIVRLVCGVIRKLASVKAATMN
jgi:hypothetical protein